jgi:UDP-N-acetylglucosamine--N-acetylmuramyl-(pentapeptide) pyrophosphoryl-undecaprenol N-acetylglucosamine transferase
MDEKTFFFAGGGTGGHIYPALAAAEKIIAIEPKAKIHFFCSSRNVDLQILKQTGFSYTQLPAKGFSIRPIKLIGFCTSFFKSYRIACEKIKGGGNCVVVGIGGFVAAPVCFAAHRLRRPTVLLNVDIVPGLANKLIARWADEIFVQFEDTNKYFARYKEKITVTGCPLRSGFENPQTEKIKKQLGLDENKKILLITGASSGSENINKTVIALLEKLNTFADSWQIVHLTGRANFEKVKSGYASAKISYKVVDYCDDMPDLLAAADLVIGRSGAVSVAEYAAAGVPSICMPYPYHKDMHQYLNAGKLVEAGAAVIVDDVPDEADRTEWLWEEMEELMKDERKRLEMKINCTAVARKDAALKIAERLLEISGTADSL